MPVDLTGQPLIIVLMGSAIAALATVIVILWRANLQMQKEKDGLAALMLQNEKDHGEKTVKLAERTLESVGILNDVLNRLSNSGGK